MTALLDYPLHVGSFGADDSPGYLKLFFIFDLDLISAGVFDALVLLSLVRIINFIVGLLTIWALWQLDGRGEGLSHGERGRDTREILSYRRLVKVLVRRLLVFKFFFLWFDGLLSLGMDENDF